MNSSKYQPLSLGNSLWFPFNSLPIAFKIFERTIANLYKNFYPVGFNNMAFQFHAIVISFTFIHSVTHLFNIC